MECTRRTLVKKRLSTGYPSDMTWLHKLILHIRSAKFPAFDGAMLIWSDKILPVHKIKSFKLSTQTWQI